MYVKYNPTTSTYRLWYLDNPLYVCTVGPTVLEVFNTLLRQLRQSVDYQLTGYYDNTVKCRTTSTEEKTLQDAVIKTIGQARGVKVPVVIK